MVAQEVGNLAKMSGKAAEETFLTLSDSIKKAEKLVGENRKKLDTGNDRVVETGRYLRDIVAAATTVETGSNQVLIASKDQASGIRQIDEAMRIFDKNTQKNAAMAEESASMSEQLNSQITNIDQLMDALLVMVNGKIKNVT